MKRTRFLLLPALALLLLIGLLGLGSQRLGLVHALGTTVQVTNCNDSGPGSLRDALASAASGSIITFSLSCDIKLNSTLTVSKTLTLDGSGYQVTLDGQQAVQVLLVPSGVTFTLKTLAIANGSSGGGIVNNGTLHIGNSTVSGNFGDGIDNFGTVRISNSTVSDNFLNGIFNGGTASITNSSVSGNGDAGIESNGSTVSITNSVVAGNSIAGNSPAGIVNNGSTVSITNSTVSGNGGGPWGPFVDGINSAYGTLRITNSTVFYNSNNGISTGGTASITNSTISGNGADGINNSGTARISNSTVSGNANGGIDNSLIANSAVLRGSILANNTCGNCFIGALSDQGDNLSSDTSCHFTASTSLQNTDPKLDPAGLANNGGPTQTIALQPDSPAVDHIPVGSKCPATDQRGVSRPHGPKCDFGAFEMTAADGLKVMIHVVNRFQLAKDLQTSLDQQVQTALADQRAHYTTQACQDLTSFINHVQAQSGIGLTTTQATQLLKEAAVIHTRLGC